VIRTIGSSGTASGQFLGPSGLSISEKSGNIYVTDFLNNRIQVLNSQGEPILVFGELGSEPGQFNSPVAIEVDDQENIYVGDALNNRVQVFDKNGNYLTSFGTAVPNANPEPLQPGQPQPEPGQFNWAVGAHYDNDKLYVSDFYNSRVQVLNISQQVPEPTSLLGLALVGIGAVSVKLKRERPTQSQER
jgi:DNA-binding beta-propeller fold protein YncE